LPVKGIHRPIGSYLTPLSRQLAIRRAARPPVPRWASVPVNREGAVTFTF